MSERVELAEGRADRHAVHYSSDREDWATPRPLYNLLDQEFIFVIDAAARADNALCPRFFGPGSPLSEDALSCRWRDYGDRFWMNPPYGRVLPKFVQAAWNAAGDGCLVVSLVPARTDTRWWAIFWDHETHKPRHDGDEVRFLKGRIRFVGAEASAPFPSAVIVMRPRHARGCNALDPYLAAADDTPAPCSCRLFEASA